LNKILTDTIVARATPAGRGGIAVTRISGPLVTAIATAMLKKMPAPRHAMFSSFYNAEKIPLDEGVAIFYPGPNTATGEDVLELQGHASPAVVDMVIREVLKNGARMARPGEFSERSFLNDKLDLAQVEAISDLIDACSEQAARAALRSLQGEFSRQIHTLVEALIHLRQYVEAAIDFAEEEIDFLADQQVAAELSAALTALQRIEDSASQGSLLRDGVVIVIAGKPNVGKSSLLNCLSGKDSAIVTDIPGTTRDVLRELITQDGMPLHIIDTAGLHDSYDPVEQEGIRRARAEIAKADLLLVVTDVAQPEEDYTQFIPDVPKKTAVIIARNKIDLTQEEPSLKKVGDKTVIALSAKENLGLDLLKNHIKACVGFHADGEGVFSARRRHLDALARAKQSLLQGQQQLENHRAGELLAEDLRQAQQALGEITGEFHSDDLLGRIFSSFCVGK
jgi:tRNA modification GTPase